MKVRYCDNVSKNREIPPGNFWTFCKIKVICIRINKNKAIKTNIELSISLAVFSLRLHKCYVNITFM